MVLKKHLYSWILPSLFLLTCIFVYYYNVLGLAFIISPEYNREFGLIENVQLLTIFGVIWVAFKAFKKSVIPLERIFYMSVVLFSILIFLEEFDYGLHVIDYFKGKTQEQLIAEAKANPVRNLHNQGQILPYLKRITYFSFALVIIVIPLVTRKIKNLNRYIKYLIVSPYIAYLLISMALIGQLTMYLNSNVEYEHISLYNNLSEFEEVLIYYIAFLYIFELSKKQFPVKPIKD